MKRCYIFRLRQTSTEDIRRLGRVFGRLKRVVAPALNGRRTIIPTQDFIESTAEHDGAETCTLGGIDVPREMVKTDDAPAAIGPYSQAIKANGFVFLSGQIALDPRTGQIVGQDIKTQTRRVLDNIRAVLEAAGSSLDRVVKCAVFLKDMNDFGPMNEEYGSYFRELPPARTTVQVAKLPRDALIEVDVIATL